MLPCAQLCGKRYRKLEDTKIEYNSVPTLKTIRVVDEKRLKDLEDMQDIIICFKYQHVQPLSSSHIVE